MMEKEKELMQKSSRKRKVRVVFEAREKTKKLIDDMKALCQVLGLSFLDEIENLVEEWKKKAIKKVRVEKNE